jgi:serine/tyrosine/threonine adenylyltransferase
MQTIWQQWILGGRGGRRRGGAERDTLPTVMRLGLQHTYFTLPARFYARVAPTPVRDPRLVAFNSRLAEEIGFDPTALEREGATWFSGNQTPDDAEPIALAYAGHQFGGFVPQLGDGRAVLLGERVGRDGLRRDIQLKGSGRTPFSRDGDGRAALGPMLREYLISEAMHALGVPTTRSLAVVTTGEQVARKELLPGAVLTRVAASHIRVGTFEYFAARNDREAVVQLLDYVITRHDPEARGADVPALAVLEAVSQRQAALIADWMSVGFIHGVMNTDNMAISGETIDYGPCAFMDHYDASTVFSSIDHGGRYAYGNQAAAAQWNLARFAETLLPLIDSDIGKAVELATAVVRNFKPYFDARLLTRMRRKIGLGSEQESDAELVRALFESMQTAGADFTLTIRRLARCVDEPADDASLLELFAPSSGIADWLRRWRERLASEPQHAAERAANMRRVNPAFIPRNHRVEAALEAASTHGDFGPFQKLLSILEHPYDDQPGCGEFEQPPAPGERVLRTFCGT